MADISRLKNLYERSISSSYSSFYRDFYAGRVARAPENVHDWTSLPLLTKADIAAVSYKKRIFINPEEVDIVRLTSGTTSAPLPIPRIKMPYTDAERLFMPVDCYMGFLLPHRVYDNYTRPGARFIGGDPARLRESAGLASKMSIEGIGGLPSTLIAFAEPLAAVYDINRIRHLCFNGDICTKLQRRALTRLYPSARSMVSSYGSSETQGLCGISIDHATSANVLLGHPLVHYEIIDEHGNALEGTSDEGELVVSTLYAGMAFPLIRYRTGDKVRMIERGGEQTVFAIQGRAITERVRFSVGTILVAEIERVLSEIAKGVVVDFEATATEVLVDGSPCFSLSITLLVPTLSAKTLDPNIARVLERELHVSEQRTYADAVERGACVPLLCTIEGLEYGMGRKPRRLTDAREQ